MKTWNEITPAQRIERWENVLRVLRALTPHQRRKHWDMSTYGVQTPCGTIACAAGHCGMDPWFRRRGLKLEFMASNFRRGVLADTWSCFKVVDFFGPKGSNEIFFDATHRTVSAVIKEVERHLTWLRENHLESA